MPQPAGPCPKALARVLAIRVTLTSIPLADATAHLSEVVRWGRLSALRHAKRTLARTAAAGPERS